MDLTPLDLDLGRIDIREVAALGTTRRPILDMTFLHVFRVFKDTCSGCSTSRCSVSYSSGVMILSKGTPSLIQHPVTQFMELVHELPRVSLTPGWSLHFDVLLHFFPAQQWVRH